MRGTGIDITQRDIFGFAMALVIIGAMAAIVFHGHFGLVNKPERQAGPALHVKIVTDPRTAGRYVPATITVHPGQRIIFKNVSDVPHTVTAANDSFDSGTIDVGQSWTFVARKTGTFRYGCNFHPAMLGVIKVQA